MRRHRVQISTSTQLYLHSLWSVWVQIGTTPNGVYLLYPATSRLDLCQ